MPTFKPKNALPSRQDILEYLAAAPGDNARRDLARAFNVRGEDRAALRALLREMEEEGALARSGPKRYAPAGALPPVLPIDVMSIEDDGALVCLPANWRGGGPPPMIRIAAREAAKTRPVPGVGDRLLARLKTAGDDGYEAFIIKPLGRGAHRFLAVYRAGRQGGVAEPVERRARQTFAVSSTDSGGAREGDLVWVEAIVGRAGPTGRGRVRDIAGHIDDRAAFSLIALAAAGAPIDLPADVIEEAERAIPPGLSGRVDLRESGLLTIDPEDARDHDDAVWAGEDDDPANPGGWRVIVAIADVSWFVRPGTRLDEEARLRGNSIYLPDRVVPMLPERLSNDLCSLRVGEDRPCIAVEMRLDRDGRKLSHKFMRAMMRSAAKLSYRDAQKAIDAGGPQHDVGKTVAQLYAAFRVRWAERSKRAPLDLDLPERRVVLGPDGQVARIEVRERLDAHRLIEEFMILANIAAAETLEAARLTQIYRVHDVPDAAKLEGVRDYLDTLGYSLVKGGSLRPQHFNQLLKIAEERDEKEMISDVVLRSQQQAVYATENLGHFGLNLARYSHFTSPIRRYADLTIHRALVSACKLGEGGQTAAEAAALSRIAEDISEAERRAMGAERDAKDRYLAAFLQDRIGAEFDGRIRGVTRFGVFVMLDETGADGFVPVAALGPGRWRFDDKRHAIFQERGHKFFRLGQSVRVELTAAAPLSGGLRFRMLSEPMTGGAVRESGPERSRPGGKENPAPEGREAKARRPGKGQTPARKGGPAPSGKAKSGSRRASNAKRRSD